MPFDSISDLPEDVHISNLEHVAMLTNTELINQSHDAILQTLDRKIGDVCYREGAFKESVTAWNGTPIIYANDHPDLELFTENPLLALEKINGRIVGMVNNPNIDITGHPRLMGNLEIDDVEINQGITDGKISHSTGFIALINGKKEVTRVVPNHVLVFRETEKNQPKDKGAFILNKQEVTEEMNTEEGTEGGATDGILEHIKNKLKDIEALVRNKEHSKEDIDEVLDFIKENPGTIDTNMMDKLYSAMDAGHQKEYLKSILKELQSQPEMLDEDMKVILKEMTQKELEETNMEGKELELTNKLEISEKEKETLTETNAGLLEKVTNMEEQLKVHEQKEADALTVKREAQWQAIKNTIPTGMLADDAAEKAMRDSFESDTHAFAVKLTEIKNTDAPKKEEGTGVVNQTEADAAKDTKALDDLGIPMIDFRSGGME